MEARLRLLLLGLTLGLPRLGMAAEGQPVEPQLERRELSAPAIDRENFEIGAFAGVLSIEDFGSNTVYGARLAYHVTEGFFLEAAYGRSEGGETSYETLSGNVQLLTAEQRKLSYYNLSLGYNLMPGEGFFFGNAFTTALYLIAGAGSTEFAGDSRFTINFGAGYRLLLTDWMAWHLDARDHLFDIDVLGESKTTHNLELTTGLTIFF